MALNFVIPESPSVDNPPSKEECLQRCYTILHFIFRQALGTKYNFEELNSMLKPDILGHLLTHIPHRGLGGLQSSDGYSFDFSACLLEKFAKIPTTQRSSEVACEIDTVISRVHHQIFPLLDFFILWYPKFYGVFQAHECKQPFEDYIKQKAREFFIAGNFSNHDEDTVVTCINAMLVREIIENCGAKKYDMFTVKVAPVEEKIPNPLLEHGIFKSSALEHLRYSLLGKKACMPVSDHATTIPDTPAAARTVKTVKKARKSAPRSVFNSMTLQTMPRDGDCLFNAIGLYMKEDASFVRLMVAAHMEANFTEFKQHHLGGDDDFRKYIDVIRNTKTWGGPIEIEVLQRLLNRPIIIIRPDANPTMFDNLDTLTGEPIFIYFDGEGHYDAFVLNEGVEARALLAEIQQKLKRGQSVKYNNAIQPTNAKRPRESSDNDGPQRKRSRINHAEVDSLSEETLNILASAHMLGSPSCRR